MREHSDFLP